MPKADVRSRTLTRGKLAAETGCNIETIRYYEQIGLLPPPPRSSGGHRLYDESFLRRLNFIRRTRGLGFTPDEIRSLLRLVDGRRHTCAQIEAMTHEQVQHIGRKIAELERIKSQLETLASECNKGEAPDCPVIDNLFDPRS